MKKIQIDENTRIVKGNRVVFGSSDIYKLQRRVKLIGSIFYWEVTHWDFQAAYKGKTIDELIRYMLCGEAYQVKQNKENQLPF